MRTWFKDEVGRTLGTGCWPPFTGLENGFELNDRLIQTYAPHTVKMVMIDCQASQVWYRLSDKLTAMDIDIFGALKL